MSRTICIMLALLGWCGAYDDAQDWGGCVCGERIGRMQEAWKKGLNVAHLRNQSREYSVYSKAGVYVQSFIFLFEDHTTELLVDRSLIENKELPIFDPTSKDLSNDASDYGMILQRAAEIHVVDSCFSLLIEVLGSFAAKIAIIHRFASRMIHAEHPTCRKHEMFQITSDMFRIQAVPLGAGNLDVDIVYPSENMVIDSRDLQIASSHEKSVQLTLQNFQVGAGELKILLKHTRYTDDQTLRTVHLLDSPLTPLIGAKCPYLQGRQMQFYDGRCILHSIEILQDPGNFSVEIQIFSSNALIYAHEVQFKIV